MIKSGREAVGEEACRRNGTPRFVLTIPAQAKTGLERGTHIRSHNPPKPKPELKPPQRVNGGSSRRAGGEERGRSSGRHRSPDKEKAATRRPFIFLTLYFQNTKLGV